MKLKNLLIPVLSGAVLGTSLLAGCGGAGNQTATTTGTTTAAATTAATTTAATTTAASTSAIEFTDCAGQTIKLEKPLEHVVVQSSGSGGAFMTMSALLGKDVYKYISGIDEGLENNRQDMWQQFIKTLPELADIPKIGSLEKDFDTEGILNSDCDALIVSTMNKEAVDAEVKEKFEKAGIHIIYIELHDETEENHVKTVEILGKAFGKEEQAQKIIDFYKEHRSNVESKVAEILKSNERPNLYIEVGSGGPAEYGNTYDNEMMWGGIAYVAGGNSIGDGVVPESGYGAIDPEYLLEKDPDKIVFAGSYWPKVADSIRLGFDSNEADTRKLVDGYLARSGWSDLKAVKNGEIYVVHHGLAREVYDVACYEFFAKLLWPEEFKDVDATATLKEYYDTFLPYEFGGTWFYEY